MPRKHFELNSDVSKLIDKYDEINDVNFNDLVNKALKFYLINQMNYKDVKDALNEADSEASKYVDETLRSSMGDINRNYSIKKDTKKAGKFNLAGFLLFIVFITVIAIPNLFAKNGFGRTDKVGN